VKFKWLTNQFILGIASGIFLVDAVFLTLGGFSKYDAVVSTWWFSMGYSVIFILLMLGRIYRKK